MPRPSLSVHRLLARVVIGAIAIMLTGCGVKLTPIDHDLQRAEIDLSDWLTQRDEDLLAWLHDMPFIAGRGRKGLVGPGPIRGWSHATPDIGELFWRDLDSGRREFIYAWVPDKGAAQIGRDVFLALGPPGDALEDWLERRRAAHSTNPFVVSDVDALRAEYLPGLGARSGRIIYLFGSLAGPQRLERLTIEAFRHQGDDVVFIEDPRSFREHGPYLHGLDPDGPRIWHSDVDGTTRRVIGPAADVTEDDCRLYYKALITTMSILSVDSQIATSMRGFDAIAEHIESRRAEPPRWRVFIGASYGATVGPALVANTPYPFDAVVLIAGGVDLLPVGAGLIDRVPIKDGPCVPPEFSVDDRAEIRRAYLSMVELDPIHWASRVTAPTLIIEPAFDHVFTSESRRLMRERLPHADVWHHASGHFGIFVFGYDMTRVVAWVDEGEVERKQSEP